LTIVYCCAMVLSSLIVAPDSYSKGATYAVQSY
jgi:hypothetical protein